MGRNAMGRNERRGLPIAVTMGDPAGIGPEILLKLLAPLAAPSMPMGQAVGSNSAAFIVYGDRAILEREARRLGLNPAGLQIRPCSSLPLDLPLGRVDPRAGEAAFLAVRAAALDAMAGKVRAVVTAPLHKEAMNAAGFHYPGHTEILAELAGGVQVRMMLANDELRTVLVTIHQSLRNAIESITEATVLETIVITHHHLEHTGVSKPRIAVAGLNPHAGEGGLMGREEIELIAPAIQAARSRGIDASGPHAPDTVFMRARRFSTFDVVVAMYHDQGLIPVKYLGLEEGVNITIGLPFVRTSPDHGTAFDIAGLGKADIRSMAAAIRMADEMSAATPLMSAATP
jgi:4-hydroxythreonine-4-phosphate dehydrogenase